MLPAKSMQHDYTECRRGKGKSSRNMFGGLPIGRATNVILRRFGMELRHLSSKKNHAIDSVLYDDPLSAIFSVRGGESAGFKCPIKDMRTYLGFGLSDTRWHPFSAAVMEDKLTDAKRSVLMYFYDCWCPESARDAIPSFNSMPSAFDAFPPSAAYLPPWSAKSPGFMSKLVENDQKKDRQNHSYLFSQACLAAHSYIEAWAQFHAERLRKVKASIESHGFDPSLGFVSCSILKRGDELAFCVTNGNHRVAVMAALGYEWVPAHIYPGPYLIDIRDVDMWPQVRSGFWSRSQALDYFNHIFDFDSLAWAKANNLWTQ